MNDSKKDSGSHEAATDNTSPVMQKVSIEANTAADYISEVAAERIFTNYLDDRFSDLIINVGGKKNYAHKVILVARCSYFEQFLCPNGQPVQINEIEITDVSPVAFQLILKYIYTGNSEVLSADTDLMLEMLNWTHKNSYSEAKEAIIEKLRSSMGMTNICAITNSANSNDLKDLLEACFEFLDRHSSEILVSNSFEKFSQETLVKLLDRATFVAPEIEIFNALVKWSKVNGKVNDCVLKNDRLSRLTVLELLTVVRSSERVDDKRLLDIISQKIKSNPQSLEQVGEKSITVLSKNDNDILRINDTDTFLSRKCIPVYHKLDKADGIIFRLEAPKKINYIKMTFGGEESKICYSYYIEVSLDQINWTKVIDYTKFLCRSDQELYFDEETVQYIRIVGTASDKDSIMSVWFSEALYKESVPQIVNGVIRPTENVSTRAKNARFESHQRSSPFCLFETEIWGYASAKSGSSVILIQLAQPYLISNMRLRMLDVGSYKYYIETSVNKNNWEMAFDSRYEKRTGWQTHHFTERPVVFIRITPTLPNLDWFYLEYFECRAAISKTRFSLWL